MIKRIISTLNKKKLCTIEELQRSPSDFRQHHLFGSIEDLIPKATVVEYCYRLAQAGYIYIYNGVYQVAQKIPSVDVTKLGVMEDEDASLYLYNRLHSLTYPDIPYKLKRRMSMLDHLHLLQFRHVGYFDFSEMWTLLEKTKRNVQNFLRDMEAFGYLYSKDGYIAFTGKYIPYSFSFKDLKRYHNRELDADQLEMVDAVIEEENEIIDTYKSNVKRTNDYNVKAVKDIEFVKSYIEEFGYLTKKERLEFIQGFYNSINYYD